MEEINYKFYEDRILNELKAYIDATYGEHYSHTKFMVKRTDIIARTS